MTVLALACVIPHGGLEEAEMSLLLGRAEGSPPWRAAVALVSGALLPAYLLLDVSWDAASFGSADLDLAVASYAFDVGNLGFASIWIAMASFAVCCGWLILSTRVVGMIIICVLLIRRSAALLKHLR